MKTIEELARLYVEARRNKLEAKYKRAALLKDDINGGYEAACSRNPNLLEAESYHREYYRWSVRAAGLIRRLENRINKANANH